MTRHTFTVPLYCRCCSKAAVGFETKVAIDIAGEGFMGTGLMVTERNWLDVYHYTKWGGNANLPAFQQGQHFVPHSIELTQVTKLSLHLVARCHRQASPGGGCCCYLLPPKRS